MSSMDFSELIKDRKGVLTADNESCGNIIGERDDSIIIEEGSVSQRIYKVPKSKISGYNGSQLLLNLSYRDLKSFAEVTEGERIGNAADSLAGKINSVSEKAVDKAKEGVDFTKEKTVDKL